MADCFGTGGTGIFLGITGLGAVAQSARALGKWNSLPLALVNTAVD